MSKITGNEVVSSDFLKVLLALKANVMKDLHACELAIVKSFTSTTCSCTLVSDPSIKIVATKLAALQVANNDIVLINFIDSDFRVNLNRFSKSQTLQSTKDAERHSINYGMIVANVSNPGSGGGQVTITVVDNLTSTVTTDALSANQGRILNNYISNINSDLSKVKSDISANTSAIEGLDSSVNSLNSTVIELNSKVNTHTNDINTNRTNITTNTNNIAALQSSMTTKANLDASNLSEENAASWKAKLNITDEELGLDKVKQDIQNLDTELTNLSQSTSTQFTNLDNRVKVTITSVSIDDSTGILTFTRDNGTTFQVDTLLEKVVTNFTYDESTKELVLTLEDGTEKRIPMTAFIDDYTGVDGDIITILISNDNKVSATIKNGTITLDKLTSTLQTQINSIGDKVDKVNGKGLSTNDFTNADKTKLDGLENYVLPEPTPTTLGGITASEVDENTIKEVKYDSLTKKLYSAYPSGLQGTTVFKDGVEQTTWNSNTKLDAKFTSTSQTVQQPTDLQIWRVNYGRNIFFGFGKLASEDTASRAVYSTDGITWNNVKLPYASGNDWFGGSCCCYGNGKFLIIGHNYSETSSDRVGYVYYSTNAIDYRYVEVEELGRLNNTVIYAKDKFVVIGDDGYRYSTDGITWTKGADTNIKGKEIVYANNVFMIINTDNQCYISTDAITWTLLYAFDSSIEISNLCFFNNKFFVMDNTNYLIYYSPNAQIWQNVPMPSAATDFLSWYNPNWGNLEVPAMLQYLGNKFYFFYQHRITNGSAYPTITYDCRYVTSEDLITWSDSTVIATGYQLFNNDIIAYNGYSKFIYLVSPDIAVFEFLPKDYASISVEYQFEAPADGVYKSSEGQSCAIYSFTITNGSVTAYVIGDKFDRFSSYTVRGTQYDPTRYEFGITVEYNGAFSYYGVKYDYITKNFIGTMINGNSSRDYEEVVGYHL